MTQLLHLIPYIKINHKKPQYHPCITQKPAYTPQNLQRLVFFQSLYDMRPSLHHEEPHITLATEEEEDDDATSEQRVPGGARVLLLWVDDFPYKPRSSCGGKKAELTLPLCILISECSLRGERRQMVP